MTTPKTPEQLATQIRTLVDDYVREAERAAVDAVAAAFSSPRSAPRKASKAKPATTTLRRQGPRRTSEQLAELADGLADVIAEHPGESMAVFARQLDVSVRDLHRPMKMLKNAGRIRSVGERHLTRYFPAMRARASA